MNRRRFMQAGVAAAGVCGGLFPMSATGATSVRGSSDPGSDTVTVFLCGDVMTGRGIDQVLAHPGDPRLHEPYVKSATGYVELAERAHGPIPAPVDFSYLWGDALAVLDRFAPQARIVNLETAVTTSDAYWEGKGINYRMHPRNVPVLTAAGIDCCVLANNHVLDWGFDGLEETLTTLEQAGMKTAGAGGDGREAAAPAVLPIEGRGRILVFGFGVPSSGIPLAWSASQRQPGVNLLPDLSAQTARRVGDGVRRIKRPGDVVIASIHWGGNWGYAVPRAERAFAHHLIDAAGVDVIHGHSSHHPKGMEVYKDRLVLYGCGDFLNDYEGIGGYEAYRDDLTLMYFTTVDPRDGRLVRLDMVPMQIRRFRLNAPGEDDVRWLADTLDRESARFGAGVRRDANGRLVLEWSAPGV